MHRVPGGFLSSAHHHYPTASFPSLLWLKPQSSAPSPSQASCPHLGQDLAFPLPSLLPREGAALFLPCAGCPLLGSALSFEPTPGADEPLGTSAANHDILAGMGMPGVPEPAWPAGGELRHCAHAARCTLFSILGPVLVAMETG